MTTFAVLPTSSAVNAGPGIPHPLYVNVQNDVGVSPPGGDLTFSAWLTKDPSSILTESSTGCFYIVPPGCGIECGNFATAWYAGDVVHIEVEQTSTGYVGTGEFTLTNDNYQMFTGINGIIIAPLPPPSEVWVDDGYYDGGTNDGHAWGYDAFATIQEGVDAVCNGGTVYVAPGTYTNDLEDTSLPIPQRYRITKSITLLGAQAGNDPAGSIDRGGESILVRTDGLPYSLYASDITIDGFMIGSSAPNTGCRLIISDVATDTTITNCIIKNTPSGSSGHGVYIYSGGTGATISYNTFYNTAWEAIAGWSVSDAEISYNQFSASGQHAIQLMGHAGSNNVITHNYFSSISSKNAIQYWGGPDLEVSYNTINGGNTMYDGIWLDNAADNSIVTNNVISDTIYAGINIRGGCTNVDVMYNDISGCGTGIEKHAGDVTGVIITCNNIYGNGMGVVNYNSVSIDAICNWWGDCSGPSGNGPGTGDAVSTNVDFDPWTGKVIADAGGPYEDDNCDYTVTFDGSGSSVPCTCVGETLTYSWNFGDGHTGTGVNPTHTYATFGEYTVTLTVTGSVYGYTDTDTATVKIYGVIAEANGPYSTEDLNPIQFDSSGSHGYLEPLSYLWDFGDGETSTLENPTHTYTQVGEYTVTLTVTESSTNQCFDADIATVVITSTVTADAHGSYEGIVGVPVDFHGSAAGGVPPYSWYWSFGDSIYSSSQSPSHIYDETGTYTVSLKVTDDINGYDTDSTYVIIHSPGTLVADAGGPYSGSVDQVIAFTGNAVGGVSPYTFEWDLDNDGDYDDATGQSASKSWSTMGTYTISLKVTDNTGTTDTDTAQVSIASQAPNKPSKPSGSTSGKAGEEYTYTSSTTDPDDDDVFYLFDWDDGTDSGWLGPYNSGDTVTASHTWTEQGNYQIKVKAKDEYDVESPWSDPLPITMPKNKAINLFMLFLERLIERFPILEQILQPIYDKLTGF